MDRKPHVYVSHQDPLVPPEVLHWAVKLFVGGSLSAVAVFLVGGSPTLFAWASESDAVIRQLVDPGIPQGSILTSTSSSQGSIVPNAGGPSDVVPAPTPVPPVPLDASVPSALHMNSIPLQDQDGRKGALLIAAPDGSGVISLEWIDYEVNLEAILAQPKYQESPDLIPSVVDSYTSSQFPWLKQVDLHIRNYVARLESLRADERTVLMQLAQAYNKKAEVWNQSNPDLFLRTDLPVKWEVDLSGSVIPVLPGDG